ncbi:MAG TPA: hypothetical protein VK665_15185, partial [Candidatus Elarobacter sp.]|nr:hypothetical protein [Candidatus Elarobacter sp.]
YLYVSIGTIPNYDPSDAFLDTETVTEQNPAWVFASAYGDFNHPGTDGAGVPTPCTVCSVSKVTSIAQNEGDTTDYSYFGVTDNGYGKDGVHWNELTYGNWQAGCNNSLCTLAYSTDSSRWYVGPDAYPDFGAASADFNPNGAVYESFDGVIADFGDDEESVRRQPLGSFVDAAPPRCASDAYGYCIAYYSGSTITEGDCTMNDETQDRTYETTGSESWLIQTPTSVLKSVSHGFQDDGSGNCTSYEYWSPEEPSVQYGDPNLP